MAKGKNNDSIADQMREAQKKMKNILQDFNIEDLRKMSNHYTPIRTQPVKVDDRIVGMSQTKGKAVTIQFDTKEDAEKFFNEFISGKYKKRRPLWPFTSKA